MLAALVFALAAAAQPAAPPPAAESRDLVVVVEGVRGTEGVVRVDLCGPETFLTERCAVSGSAPAHEGAVAVVLPGVPAGEYAVQAWHDRNVNGRVDRNGLGVPTEAFGFSRSPPLGLSGPRFVRAAFAHGAEPQAVTVRLRRLF